MLELINAILQTLWSLVVFRYTFAGLIVGSGINFVFEKAGPDVTGDRIFIIIATCALTGLVLDIRRWFKE